MTLSGAAIGIGPLGGINRSIFSVRFIARAFCSQSVACIVTLAVAAVLPLTGFAQVSDPLAEFRKASEKNLPGVVANTIDGMRSLYDFTHSSAVDAYQKHECELLKLATEPSENRLPALGAARVLGQLPRPWRASACLAEGEPNDFESVLHRNLKELNSEEHRSDADTFDRALMNSEGLYYSALAEMRSGASRSTDQTEYKEHLSRLSALLTRVTGYTDSGYAPIANMLLGLTYQSMALAVGKIALTTSILPDEKNPKNALGDFRAVMQSYQAIRAFARVIAIAKDEIHLGLKRADKLVADARYHSALWQALRGDRDQATALLEEITNTPCREAKPKEVDHIYVERPLQFPIPWFPQPADLPPEVQINQMNNPVQLARYTSCLVNRIDHATTFGDFLAQLGAYRNQDYQIVLLTFKGETDEERKAVKRRIQEAINTVKDDLVAPTQTDQATANLQSCLHEVVGQPVPQAQECLAVRPLHGDWNIYDIGKSTPPPGLAVGGWLTRESAEKAKKIIHERGIAPGAYLSRPRISE